MFFGACFAVVLVNLVVSILKKKWLSRCLVSVLIVLCHRVVGISIFWLVTVWPAKIRIIFVLQSAMEMRMFSVYVQYPCCGEKLKHTYTAFFFCKVWHTLVCRVDGLTPFYADWVEFSRCSLYCFSICSIACQILQASWNLVHFFEALCYKPEGHKLDFRWGHWIFQLA
jgi:hypothetical protein